jgi:Neocarzinostatin family
MKRSTIARGFSWAGAVAGTSVLVLTLTGGAAFAGTAKAHATWNGKLKNNTVVTVGGKNWVPGDTLVLSECNPNLNESACDDSTIKEATVSPTGKIPAGTTLTWTTGTVGNGTCNKGQVCYITVADLTQLENGDQSADYVEIPVTVGSKDS